MAVPPPPHRRCFAGQRMGCQQYHLGRTDQAAHADGIRPGGRWPCHVSGESTILNGKREPPLSGWCQDGESAVRKVGGPCADRAAISEWTDGDSERESPCTMTGNAAICRNYLESREES